MRKLIKPIKFDWDESNPTKNYERHNVTWEEAENIFSNEPITIMDDAAHSTNEKRYSALGKTQKNRKLFVVFTERNNKIRIISARDMSKKERSTYEAIEADSPIQD
ncbi:MAG: BrnT family toxin [Candidatus Saccharimonadales bacterium]